jgi:hypothetical protein
MSSYISGAQAQDRVVGPVLVDDVDLVGQVGRLFPGFEAVAEEQALELALDRHDGDQRVRDVDQRGGLLDHLAGRGPFAAVDDRVGDDGAEPVEEVDDLVAGDAGEEVLVAAGEADHLVREDRAEDQERVQ